MNTQEFIKYEYKYVKLRSNIDITIELLNDFGNDGWEVIELEKPKSTGDVYKAFMKRKLDCMLSIKI